ncbi:CLUMA_CG014082, isoform A [Clunio marinus]|uniref:CLUMA_CG014082, isoform A n=1 Tax=Clunio marinus TaxID=568069 RepID=A0A1J1IKS2_9DIPT|nr:CLUMA_CG014082, isoform A [Clunio marinus]
MRPPQNPDEDPLPNEDVSENNSNNGESHNDLVKINMSNETAEAMGHLKNGEKPEPDDHDITDMHHHLGGHHKQNKYVSWCKLIVLLIAWFMFTVFLMSKNEKTLHYRQLAIPKDNDTKTYVLADLPIEPRVGLIFKGSFYNEHYDNDSTNYLHYYLSIYDPITNSTKNITKEFTFPIVNITEMDKVKEIKRVKVVDLNEMAYRMLYDNRSAVLNLNLITNFDESFPLNFAYDPSPLDKDRGIIYATIVLLGLYVMIIWELVHRTFAAIIASTMAIGILAAMNERPPMTLIMSWIDIETLLLLFGMMILVAILSETGIFDYLAVYAYKITNGAVWPLINCLCLFTAILSSFLDNVTTVLLMTPVTIRLCEVMELNPVPILMSMVIYSNIGGALTPVGDPPNVIIASNSHISKKGVNFTTFTLHMAIGVCLVMVQTYFQLKHKFRNINDLRFSEPNDVQELRHEISVWQRAAASLSSYSKDEDLVRETLLKKVNRLGRQLKKKLVSGSIPTESYKATLEDLQAKYPIRNKKLLVKSSVTLIFVISFFFLHSVPNLQRLSLGWTALLGAILLLILSDREDMEAVLARVEWSTLLFFAALFVLMEALSELGLIDWIGRQTENVILSVGEESRLAVAILIILWVSALASAFVDNIPLTTMMVKIAISLSENEALNLPLQPLVWALAFGACLGGNGTLIGASANVVCAGVAEQHGYRFTFVEFFKVGFPVMIGSICVATVYLMMAHVVFEWHSPDL